MHERLFAIDVLAGFRRRDRDQRVPVIRRRDAHRIDVLPREQFPEIVVGRALLRPALLLVEFLDAAFGVLPPRRIDIANRHHLDGIVLAHERAEQVSGLFAHADESDRDLLTRFCFRRPDASGQELGRGAGRQCGLEK